MLSNPAVLTIVGADVGSFSDDVAAANLSQCVSFGAA